MRRIKITGVALVAVLAMCATAAGTASAAKLTLSEGGVALPVGYRFEVFGRNNIFVHTPIGDILCNQNAGFEEGYGGLTVEVLTNTASTAKLRVIGAFGMLRGLPSCRDSFEGFGRAAVILEEPGVLKLTSWGKATEGPVRFLFRFERGQQCYFTKSRLIGTSDATATRGSLAFGFSAQRLHLDKGFRSSEECPTEAELSASFDSTRNEEEEEEERIEVQIVGGIA